MSTHSLLCVYVFLRSNCVCVCVCVCVECNGENTSRDVGDIVQEVT